MNNKHHFLMDTVLPGIWCHCSFVIMFCIQVTDAGAFEVECDKLAKFADYKSISVVLDDDLLHKVVLRVFRGDDRENELVSQSMIAKGECEFRVLNGSLGRRLIVVEVERQEVVRRDFVVHCAPQTPLGQKGEEGLWRFSFVPGKGHDGYAEYLKGLQGSVVFARSEYGVDGSAVVGSLTSEGGWRRPLAAREDVFRVEDGLVCEAANPKGLFSLGRNVVRITLQDLQWQYGISLIPGHEDAVYRLEPIQVPGRDDGFLMHDVGRVVDAGIITVADFRAEVSMRMEPIEYPYGYLPIGCPGFDPVLEFNEPYWGLDVAAHKQSDHPRYYMAKRSYSAEDLLTLGNNVDYARLLREEHGKGADDLPVTIMVTPQKITYSMPYKHVAYLNFGNLDRRWGFVVNEFSLLRSIVDDTFRMLEESDEQ